VYVFWWDTNGSVGRLFPNPSLTEGTGQVKAHKTYWLPSGKDGERWYVLDNNPGYENIYFVASRDKNPKLEALYDRIERLSREPQSPTKTKVAAGELEREINLMGISNYTVPKTASTGASSSNREQLFNELQNQIQVSGADKVVQLRLKHE
jgi:hypothetical protein